MKELDDITGAVVDSAMKIHKELGPGLLESVYEVVLARALERRSLQVEQRVVVELKSVEKLAPVNSKQLLTHLRLINLLVGLLINFGSATLKEGLHRIVNKLPSSASPREPFRGRTMNEAETRAEQGRYQTFSHLSLTVFDRLYE